MSPVPRRQKKPPKTAAPNWFLQDRLAPLLTRTGQFQPAPELSYPPHPEQCQWELFRAPDPLGKGPWRILYRYSRPDVCGIEVYDLSDPDARSWQKPLVGVPQWSGRDHGIWRFGVDLLDKVMSEDPDEASLTKIAAHEQLVRRISSDRTIRDTPAARAEIAKSWDRLTPDEQAYFTGRQL